MTVFVWGHGGATHGLLAGVFLAKGQHPVIFTLCEGQTHPDCRQVDRTKAEPDGAVCCFVWVRTAAFLLTFQVSPSGLNPAERTAEVIPQLTWRLGVVTFRCSPFQTPCDSLLCTLRLSKSAEALCSRSHRSTQSLACGKKAPMHRHRTGRSTPCGSRPEISLATSANFRNLALCRLRSSQRLLALEFWIG